MIHYLVLVCSKIQENAPSRASVNLDCVFMVTVCVKMVKNVIVVVNVFLEIVKEMIRAITFITQKGFALISRMVHTVRLLNSVPLMYLVSRAIVVFKMVKIVQTRISVRLSPVITRHAEQFQMVHSVREQINVKQIQYVLMVNVVLKTEEVAKNQISVLMFLATNKLVWRFQMVERVQDQPSVFREAIALILNVGLTILTVVTLTVLLGVHVYVIVPF